MCEGFAQEKETAPRAEVLSHFPNRTAAFVWRNWNLIDKESLAQTLGVEAQKIDEYADILGLPEYQTPIWEPERAYITILRRNWGLLPEEQILTLLKLTPEDYAKRLREDDFLAVKLGVKPYCEPLRYEPIDEAVREKCREISQIASPIFNSPSYRNAEPRFSFVQEFMRDVKDDELRKSSNESQSTFEICYLHSFFAVFGDPLLQDSRALYPDGLLQELAARGVNGVWLHALLRDITPPTDDFPEFGQDSEKRRATLRELARRAERFGIKVYLYMNEPRAMPAGFFNNRRDVEGVSEGDYCAMCASSPKVRRWIVDSLSALFTDVPGLGGVFTISGSENLTTCVSHRRFAECPRCSQHTDVELISDLNAAIAEGVHRAAPDAKVIVWDWGWRGHGFATDIIAALPKDVWLQSVSEWGIPISRGGVDTIVGEYSISVVGPGERAKAHWRAAKEAGLKTIAKCQFNTTWELGSVPSIPALELVARHAKALSAEGVDGVMAGWSLGGAPSVNLEVANAFATNPNATIDETLDRFANRYFGSGAEAAREGWRLASRGFQEFPYHGSVVYSSPVQIGAANLMRLEPAGMRATMVGIPYDDLDAWRGPYPATIFADQTSKCAQGFLAGADALDRALELAKANGDDTRTEADRAEAARQARYARYAGRVYESVACQTRFIETHDDLLALKNDPNGDPGQMRELRKELRALLKEEIGTTKETLKLVCEDSRLGFESTNQYWFAPIDLVEKIVSCEFLDAQLRAELE